MTNRRFPHRSDREPLIYSDALIIFLIADDKKQSSMAAFVQTPAIKKVNDELITKAIADMIVTDYVPLSIVEGEGFNRMMNIVAPGNKVPTRKTVRSRIQQRYDTEKEKLCDELNDVTSTAITTDTWTSNSTESYITVTEHHIDDAWEMKSNVLMTRAMPERHTGENLATRLTDCVEEFNLQGKVETCVHDNARNMECAGNICDQWNDFGCFGHTIQLCLKPALDLPKVSLVVSKCRKLVGHFKHSTTLTAEMKVRQKSMGLKENVLIQDVATRWNSTYEMMARLGEQRRVISDILLDTKFAKKSDSALYLTDREWELLKELCDVFSVFSDVTTYMCSEKSLSLSEVLPIVSGLVDKRLCVSETDCSTVAKVKEVIKDELQRRYKPASDVTAGSTAALAMLLDPRYKKLPFFTSSKRRTTTDALESRLDDLPLKRPETESRSDQETPAKRRKLDFLSYDSPDRSAQDELQCYLAEKMVPDCEPLHWWRKNEHRFPQIALVARRVLAVPATSVPSERIFSAAGLLINKLRNRLSSDIVDKIIFLNKNHVNISACDYD